MHLIKNLLVAFLIASQVAFGGLPPTSSKGSNDSTPVTTFEFDFPNAVVTHTGTRASVAIPDAAGATGATTNYITNPGAETNVTTGVTVSGATVTRNTTTPLYQTADFSISLGNNATDTVTYSLNTLDNSLKGQNCQLQFYYTASSVGSNVVAQVLQGSNVVAQSPALTINSSSTPINLNVPCGDLSSATTVVIRNGTGSTGTSALKGDKIYYGLALNLSVGALPTVSWSGYHDASYSNWNFTSTGSFADPASNTSDGNDVTEITNNNFGTVTSYVSGARKLPGIVFTPKKTGRYYVCAIPGPSNAGVAQGGSFQLTNLTTSTVITEASAQDSSSSGSPPLCGITNITSLVSTTIAVQGKRGAAGTMLITSYNTTTRMMNWSIFSLDDQVQTAYTPDLQALSWSGYHNLSGSWTRTNTAFGDFPAGTSVVLTQLSSKNLTCTTISGSLPGITCVLPKTGTYEVCSEIESNQSANASTYRMVDGAGTVFALGVNGSVNNRVGMTLCGLYNAQSIGSTSFKIQGAANVGDNNISDSVSGGAAISWVVKAIDQNIPTPVLVGGFTNSYTGSNRIAWAYIANTCNASPCTIASQSGDFTSITRTSTGAYVANFPANTFLLTPSCVVFSEAAVTFVDGAPSSTAWPFGTYNTAFSRVDYGKISIQCMNGR